MIASSVPSQQAKLFQSASQSSIGTGLECCYYILGCRPVVQVSLSSRSFVADILLLDSFGHLHSYIIGGHCYTSDK